MKMPHIFHFPFFFEIFRGAFVAPCPPPPPPHGAAPVFSGLSQIAKNAKISQIWCIVRLKGEMIVGCIFSLFNTSMHNICSPILLFAINLIWTQHIYSGGALTLERGMGMCCGHDPLFSGQSPLPSLPIYRQCAALVTPGRFQLLENFWFSAMFWPKF